MEINKIVASLLMADLFVKMLSRRHFNKFKQRANALLRKIFNARLFAGTDYSRQDALVIFDDIEYIQEVGYHFKNQAFNN